MLNLNHMPSSLGVKFDRFNHKTGFTIVELLVVIVIIAVLAVLVVVTFSSANEKAKFSKYQTDLKSLNAAVMIYHSANGHYPISTAWRGDNQAINDSFIPGLVPTYLQKTPQVESVGSARPTFLYTSTATGSDYKLLYIVAMGDTLPAAQLTSNPLIDPVRPTRAWGYWSPGGASL